MAPCWIAFATSQFVFAGYFGEPFSNRAVEPPAARSMQSGRGGEITAHGPARRRAFAVLKESSSFAILLKGIDTIFVG
jgi:hypothetical protein